jgi:V/A-type H+-transporting ATPase subunit I
MAKMTILGAREDQDEVLDSLMRSGAVEIVKNNELDEERTVSTASIDNVDLRVRLSRIIAVMQRRFPEAKRLSIQKLPVKEKDFLFTDKEENELRALVSQFEAQLEQEEAIAAKLSRLEQQVEQLLPWQDIPVDLSQHETARTKLIYGIFMDALSFESFESDLRRDYPLATSFFLEEEGLFPAKVAVVSLDEQLAGVRARLSSCDFHEIPKLPFTGTAHATILSIQREIEEEQENKQKLDQELEAMADDCGRLMTYHDYLLVRSDHRLAGEEIRELDYTFFLQVWVPKTLASDMGRELSERFDIAWISEDPKEGEETPVKLENNKIFRPFEVILEMYGAPSSHEVDPMPVMAPFYMILFGMMLSDVGYGAMLMLGTAYMLFGRKVEGNTRQMSMMLFISGISSVIWGFIFGGFFGDMLTAVTMGKVNFPALWFNPMDSPVQLLLFSMVFGVIHLFFGLGLHIRNEKMQGNLIGGLADSVTWYLIIPGLGLMLGAGAIAEQASTVELLKQVGQWLVIGGAAFGLIFAGHGIKNPFKRLIKGLGALYGITSYLSDILSYARILALVLATSVIATVVNMLGMLVGPSFIGYIVFALIGAFGHTLNLALSALSAFVHTSRLQYVELFGKFFVGGGSFWNPLSRRTKYIRIEDDTSSN